MALSAAMFNNILSEQCMPISSNKGILSPSMHKVVFVFLPISFNVFWVIKKRSYVMFWLRKKRFFLKSGSLGMIIFYVNL